MAALVLALWPVVADAPWENDSQLKADMLDLQLDISTLEAEAEAEAEADAEADANTPASESEICKSATKVILLLAQADNQGHNEAIDNLFLAATQTAIENGCLAD